MPNQFWKQFALCKTVDTALFFPIHYQGLAKNKKYKQEAVAKSLCKACPVRLACLDFALKYGETGIWGGMNELERKQWRRKKRYSTNASTQKHNTNI